MACPAATLSAFYSGLNYYYCSGTYYYAFYINGEPVKLVHTLRLPSSGDFILCVFGAPSRWLCIRSLVKAAPV